MTPHFFRRGVEAHMCANIHEHRQVLQCVLNAPLLTSETLTMRDDAIPVSQTIRWKTWELENVRPRAPE